MSLPEVYIRSLPIAVMLAASAAACITDRRLRRGKSTDADDIGLFIVVTSIGWPLALLAVVLFPMLNPDPARAPTSLVARVVNWATGNS